MIRFSGRCDASAPAIGNALGIAARNTHAWSAFEVLFEKNLARGGIREPYVLLDRRGPAPKPMKTGNRGSQQFYYFPAPLSVR